VGEVVVRGPVVSPAYADRPEATAAAKLDWDGRTAHRMGDLASWDDEGRLWFAGRKAHVVHTAGRPDAQRAVRGGLQPPPGRPAQRPGRRGPAGRAEPVLCVQLEAGTDPSAALTGQLLALGDADPRTAPIRRILYKDDFPVDIRHNSKIDRAQLGRWATGQP
jgi:hypothetical protein